MTSNDIKLLPPLPEARLQVQAIRKKLHTRAIEDPSRTFDDIYNWVYSLYVLTVATALVLSNDGKDTAGVDGITKADIEQMGREQFVLELHEKLKTGKYRPNHLRPVDIKKSNGKMRRLEIPTITDRVVQKAVTLVLEGIFEADFLPCSHAYRPAPKGCHTAIASIRDGIHNNPTFTWGVTADVLDCFGTIDHRLLLERLRLRVKDRRVLELVKMFLRAGTAHPRGEITARTRGIPQGGCLSPFLCNVALTPLDLKVMSLCGAQNNLPRTTSLSTAPALQYERYADDLCILVEGAEADAIEAEVHLAELLGALNMDLAKGKTTRNELQVGFEYLSYHFQKVQVGGAITCALLPAQAKVDKLLQYMKSPRGKNGKEDDPEKVVDRVQGFVNYYYPLVPGDVLGRILDDVEISFRELLQKHKESQGITNTTYSSRDRRRTAT